MYKLPRDVLVLPEGHGRWLVMNVFARSSLGLDTATLEILRQAETLDAAELQAAHAGRKFWIWETAAFTNLDGLLADPSRYLRDVNAWRKRGVDLDAFLEACLKQFILIEDEAAYRARFALKTSLLDHKHFGNFHQQIGQELLLTRRVDPEQWWLQQKFTNDLSGVRNTLYKAVQEYGLRGYFADRISAGDVVVDLGCGTGHNSRMIAEAGAEVLGIDPKPEFIEYARRAAASRVRFEVLPVGTLGGLDSVPDASADYVFMSDALLFYFVPPTPTTQADIGVLLNDIRRILKPNGRFISCDPHYLFWLKPWLGEVEQPFTIFSEYCDEHTYGVMPTLACFIQALGKNGFAVTYMEELQPDPKFQDTDPRAYHFARRFPVWQLFEFVPIR